METNEFIRNLAASAAPVRRLASPARRTGIWLAISLPYVAAVIVTSILASDTLSRIDARQVIELIAALTTAAAAAYAAFSLTVPGRDARVALLPLVPLAIWLASLGESCLHDWRTLGSDALALHSDRMCAPWAIVLSTVPALVIFTMLRRGAPLMPGVTLALGALAVASLANFGLRLFHIGDISIMVLVWHLGVAGLVSLLAALAGRYALNWDAFTAGGGARVF
jgi:hypothetical protein